jgi:hypothetical protein
VPRGNYVSTPQGRNFQKVTTNLVAWPVLYVDNYIVADAPLIYFGLTF